VKMYQLTLLTILTILTPLLITCRTSNGLGKSSESIESSEYTESDNADIFKPIIMTSFEITTSWFLFQNQYYVEDSNRKYYYFDKNWFTSTCDLTMRYENSLIGYTHTLLFSWAQSINLYDGNDNKIYSVVETNPWYHFDGIDQYFTILDNNKKPIGSIEYTQYFFSNVLVFFDNDNNAIAKGTYNMWSSSWNFDIYNKLSTVADFRLIGMFATHKTFETDEISSQSNNQNYNTADMMGSSQITKVADHDIDTIISVAETYPTLSNYKLTNPDIAIICVIAGIISFVTAVFFTLRCISQEQLNILSFNISVAMNICCMKCMNCVKYVSCMNCMNMCKKTPIIKEYEYVHINSQSNSQFDANNQPTNDRPINEQMNDQNNKQINNQHGFHKFTGYQTCINI